MQEIIVIVEKDPECGLGEAIFTQAETLDELKENIRDAIRCHFDNPENYTAIIRQES
jgi:hypothetical protein